MWFDVDMTASIQPKSDQLNADDLTTGPVTVTISAVKQGSSEQPVNVELHETPGRAYRPGKSMARVMVAAWGKESDAYIGQRMTLYCDPSITFGPEKVGGIRISHMTGISKPLKVALTVTRGKKRLFTVQPLTEPASTPTDSITESTWAEINSLAAEKGIENVPEWIGEQLGRKLQGWREISISEGDALLKTLTTGEVQ